MRQTNESLRKLTIEETYELADAITGGNNEGIRNELCDLMLHIVFYSKIGKEKGAFTITDVLKGINDKLVYRHPHVFADTKVKGPREVEENWEKLKMKEGRKSAIEGVPEQLPALAKAYRIQEKASKVGFDWNDSEPAFAKILEELNELRENVNNGKGEREIEDEMGGKDAVVEKALEWVNNLIYPHNTITDRSYYSPVVDTVHLSTTIENPNSHLLSARAYLKTVEGILIDSVDLEKQTLNSGSENWIARINKPSFEEICKIALTVFDETALDHFTVPNATRFATAGPVVLDSISYTKVSVDNFTVKPFVKNQSTVATITSASIKLICDDPWITSITPSSRPLPIIPPGIVVSPSSGFTVRVDSTFTDPQFLRALHLELYTKPSPRWLLIRS